MKLRKTHSIAAFLVFLFSILLLPPPSYALIATVNGIVSKVSDGDTLHVITEKGKNLKIKLYGCDAPEIEKRNKRTGQITVPGQPYSEEAKQALKKMIYKKRVCVDIIDIDRHHWMASLIWLKKRCINLEMVREGYAEAYQERLKQPYYAEFSYTEQQAKFRKKGIWGLSNYERPSEFRKRLRIRGS